MPWLRAASCSSSRLMSELSETGTGATLTAGVGAWRCRSLDRRGQLGGLERDAVEDVAFGRLDLREPVVGEQLTEDQTAGHDDWRPVRVEGRHAAALLERQGRQAVELFLDGGVREAVALDALAVE